MRFRSKRPRSWTGTEKLAAAAAGLAGGVAYAVVMATDLRLFRYNADDYLLLGGVFGLPPVPASRVGKGIHLVNSAVLGILFERLAYHRLPYSAAVNGVIFATIENAVLYPVFIVEHLHPLIERGNLPSYRTSAAFTQSALRHVAYGAVTGWTLHSLLRRSSSKP